MNQMQKSLQNADEEVSLWCSQAKMMVALENIIDNQLRYAETKIAVELKRVQSHLLINIYNDGPNINEADIKKNFLTNFTRTKKATLGWGLRTVEKLSPFIMAQFRLSIMPKGSVFRLKSLYNCTRDENQHKVGFFNTARGQAVRRTACPPLPRFYKYWLY
jgi:K+-sensing histidine kinase KdpD